MAVFRKLSAAGVNRPPLTKPMRAKVRITTESHNAKGTPAPSIAIVRCSSGSRSDHEMPSILHLCSIAPRDSQASNLKDLLKLSAGRKGAAAQKFPSPPIVVFSVHEIRRT